MFTTPAENCRQMPVFNEKVNETLPKLINSSLLSVNLEYPTKQGLIILYVCISVNSKLVFYITHYLVSDAFLINKKN